MAFDRTTIVRGPCKITYDGATFYSKGGVTMTLTNSTFDKETDAYGLAGRGKTDMTIVVEFEPVGEIEALTVLFPYGSTAIGASIFTGSDKPLVIVSASATYTIKCAAVTQMPSIRMTATNTAFGSVQFTGILDRTNGEPDDIASYYAISAGASIGTTFNPSLMITGPCYGETNFLNSGLAFYSETGFEIAFDQSNTPILVDGFGTVDMALANLGATITFTPTGLAEASGVDGFDGFQIGADLPAEGLSIVCSPTGGLTVEFLAVQIIDQQRRFSPSENRLGQITMQALRMFAGGEPQEFFTVGTNT